MTEPEIDQLKLHIRELTANEYRFTEKVVALESQVRSFRDIAEHLASAIDAIANRGKG